MRIKKTFEIVFDEPDPHWLCADNLIIALQAYCTNTKFEVTEISREPEYPLYREIKETDVEVLPIKSIVATSIATRKKDFPNATVIAYGEWCDVVQEEHIVFICIFPQSWRKRYGADWIIPKITLSRIIELWDLLHTRDITCGYCDLEKAISLAATIINDIPTEQPTRS